MEAISLIIVGLIVGVISSFFGVGGGIVVVPSIYLLFPELDPKTAIGSSLILIFMNSSLNFMRFKKRGYVLNKGLFAQISGGFIVGILASSMLIKALNPDTIRLLFVGMLAITAARVLLSKQENTEESAKTDSMQLNIVIGIISGLISGLTGLGGGAIMVPLFITILKLPLSKVSFLSNSIMPIGTFFGAISFMSMASPKWVPESFSAFQIGQGNLLMAILIFAGAFTTGKLGIKWGEQASQTLKNRLFAALLIIMGLRILSRYLF